MTPSFDPFTETPAPPPPASDPAFERARRGRDWTPPEEGIVEQLWRIVRRRKLLIIQAVVIVPLVALAYSLHQTSMYTASASMLFRDPTAGIISTAASNVAVDPARTSATNDALIGLPVVSTYASRSVDGKIPAGEIQSSVTIDSGSGASDVVQIEAVSSSPQRAADIANAYAKGYIEFRRAADRDALAQSAKDLTDQLDRMSAQQRDGPDGRQLQSRLNAISTAEALRTGGAELVQPASPPSSASSPKTKRNVIIGIFVGLLLGLGLAALLERLDQRIRDVDDFERIYGVPVIARVPRRRWIGQGDDLDGMAESDIEAFRMLRANLRYLSFEEPLRSLLVASPVPGDGKSTVARLLAETMATMGDRVVLVDVDLHKDPGGGPAGPGLSTVLIGGDLDRALATDSIDARGAGKARALTVLPAGPAPPNPSELVDSERMQDVLVELERRFDLVIIDAPALARVSDGLALVQAVTGILIVGGLGNTTVRAAENLRQQVALLGGRPLGVVANFVPLPRDSYGYGDGR